MFTINFSKTQAPKIVTNQNISSISPSGMLPPRLKERSGSLPPSALPRPPRSLKPPRKIDYDRLSDADLKARAQTPPKLPPSPTTSSSSTVTTASTSSQPTIQQQPPPSKYDLKSSTLKRNEFGRREFSPSKSYMEMKDSLSAFPKPDFSLKRKDYGSISKTEFSKPDYTSTKNYHRLEESPKPTRVVASNPSTVSQDPSFKRSLLPSARKYSPAPSNQSGMVVGSISLPKSSRDSLNSSESNNSSNSNQRTSPMHIKTDSNLSSSTTTTSAAAAANQTGQYHHPHSRTPPKYIPLSPQEKSLLVARQQNNQRQLQLQANKSSLPPISSASSASLPPKPVDKNTRRSGSLTRGENRYRIQF